MYFDSEDYRVKHEVVEIKYKMGEKVIADSNYQMKSNYFKFEHQIGNINWVGLKFKNGDIFQGEIPNSPVSVVYGILIKKGESPYKDIIYEGSWRNGYLNG